MIRQYYAQRRRAGPKSPVRRFLDASTRHLEKADRLFLEFSADPGKCDGLAAMAGTFGWFVYAADDRDGEEISDVLWTIFLHARSLGCDYVLFDADGPVLEGLPMFEQDGDETEEQAGTGGGLERTAAATAAAIAEQVLYWVAAYLVTLSHGGPEEGGWWYESGELVTEPDVYRQLGSPPRAFFDRNDAHVALSRLEPNLPQLNAGRPPLHASTSTGLHEVHVMHALSLPLAFPRTRPVYG